MIITHRGGDSGTGLGGDIINTAGGCHMDLRLPKLCAVEEKGSLSGTMKLSVGDHRP